MKFILHSLSKDGRGKTPNWPPRTGSYVSLLDSNRYDAIFSINQHNARFEESCIRLVN